ncbi:MAG: AAA family ATPase [Deltaproteobacteria bacterium]|nr:AAA family ATPase [Deltaproteobacteria bacterium]
MTAPVNPSAATDFSGLRRLRVAGLGSLRDVTLHPGRLTVLIGANGSGKSNVLKALNMVPLLPARGLQRFIGQAGGASALLHYGPQQTESIELELDFALDGHTYGYRASLGFAAGDKLLFLDERVAYQGNPGVAMRTTPLGTDHWESLLRSAAPNSHEATSVHYWTAQLIHFHFHDTSLTSALRTNARAVDDRALRSDGGNLAAFLLRLASSVDAADQKAWRRINAYVSRVVPSIKSLEPTRLDSNTSAARLDWIDDRDERFGAHHLSDGSLRAIAIITALAQPAERMPRFISIDEPELGLHPAAISLVAELARSVSHRTQVLFATQSTAFLDHFSPEEVVVAERADGATTLRRLDPAALQTWLDDYSLSEVFDKGVIGGRP